MKRRRVSCFIFGFLCLAVMVAGIIFYIQKQEELAPKRHDLERISQESFDSVFLSMYPLSGYSEEDFAFYRGTDTIISTYSIPKLAVLSEYMDAVFDSTNEITNVFLGLDPGQIWDSCGEKVDKWNRQMEEDFLTFLTAHPQVSFEIMLAYPQMDYWTSMTEEEMDTVLTTYRNLIHSLEAYSNVTIYYLGAEQWLIENPRNYVGETDVNAMVAQKIMLYTFCDHVYQISAENADTYLENLQALAAKERSLPAVYPDFSGWKLVFFGDSVIGNYNGSSSIPGVISALTGADTYNYALGGSQAADYEGYDVAFPDRVEQFLIRQLELTQDNTVFPYGTVAEDDSQLCFLVHYGLNDYFNGCLIEDGAEPSNAETYGGALRVGVKRLREAYPNAVIILMTPPYTDFFSGGTEKNSEVGGVLEDYVETVEQVAREQDVICMNNYEDLGITAETSHIYLEDGVHLNEQGRFVLGRNIIHVLENMQEK